MNAFKEMNFYFSVQKKRFNPKQNNFLKKANSYLLQETQKQMEAQTAPSGNAWIKRLKGDDPQFKKLRQRRYLRSKINNNSLILGWSGSSGRIAAQHHYGGRYHLRNGKSALYPARPLLGFTKERIKTLEAIFLNE